MTTEALIAAVEALPLGQPWDAPLGAAAAAIAGDRAAAQAALFPGELVPVPADAIAAYSWHIERLTAHSYGERIAEIHRRAMTTYPALAALLRSHEALDDVAAAAAQLATPASIVETHATAGARASTEARARYQMAIARQLAHVTEHELSAAASVLLACEDLDTRLRAAVARHEAHLQAAAEQLELERKAAAAAELLEQERRAAATAEAVAAAERLRAAERAATAAGDAAGEAQNTYRVARADAFVSRIRAAGLSKLRVGKSLHNVDELAAAAPSLSLSELAAYEAALADKLDDKLEVLDRETRGAR